MIATYHRRSELVKLANRFQGYLPRYQRVQTVTISVEDAIWGVLS